MAEPRIRIETREELIYLLAEAAALEHSIMCCYFYAAWSLRRTEADGLTSRQVEAVTGWRRAIVSVAVEEMTHLALVANLTSSIGGGVHFSRPDFPIPPGRHPSGVVLELARFSPALLDHFIYLERPEGVELHDATGFAHPHSFHRTLPKGRLMPSAQDYLTVGHLYRGIRHGFEVLAHMHGESALFVGDVGAQVSPTEASLPGLSTVFDLKSAEAAIGTIIEQGEGAPSHSDDSHYNRFVRVKAQLDAFLADDPGFDPAFPVAHNPVTYHPQTGGSHVYINAAESVQVLDLANSLYTHMVRSLVQSFGRAAERRADKMTLVSFAIDLMFVLDKVASHLASLPASHVHPGVNAGMTFSLPRDVQRLPEGRVERALLHERVVEMSIQAGHLFPAPHPLSAIAEQLAAIGQPIAALADR
ncbi:MAG: ferritin-like protein [Devosia sp.]